MKTSILLVLLIFSLWVNGFFMMQDMQEKHEKKLEQKKAQEAKIYFTEKLFSDNFKLKDYSAAKFTLEQKGKDIIKNAREFHSSPAIVKWDAYDEYVCAGYIFGLSKILWDPSAPYMIGMMEQNTKTPADAWQLPYSYEYVGWKVLADFTWDFSLDTKDYWEKIDTEKLEKFFDISFSEAALFWDIWFLYKQTEFLHDLKIYENANSHIAKNIGLSDFSRTVNNPKNKDHMTILSETLSCDESVFPKMKNLFTHYDFHLDGNKIVFYKDEFYYLLDDNSLWKKVVFTDMSELSFSDTTLMHFFEGAKVESLLEMTCQGEFFPINVLSINPRFIEKM